MGRCYAIAGSLLFTRNRDKEWCGTEGCYSELIWSYIFAHRKNWKSAVFGAGFVFGDLHGTSSFTLVFCFTILSSVNVSLM